MPASAPHLQSLIQAALPGAQVSVTDPQNDGTHLQAHVAAPQFAGLPRIAQHRLVYAALGDAFSTNLHALALTTEVLPSSPRK